MAYTIAHQEFTTMHRPRLHRAKALLIAALAVSGCAFNSVHPGMSRDDVLAHMGTPTRILPMEAGITRLQYSRQPAGQQVFNVDLDATGRVLSVLQMLEEQEFARIVVDQWTREDVERAFGPPASIDHVGNWPADIMTYRWLEVQSMFYWVYLDHNNVVRRTGKGVEYPVDD
jgi:hypothetical protein